MQKEGGAGEHTPSCESKKAERLGDSAGPLQSDRPIDWQISL